jgi:hypothetical protein
MMWLREADRAFMVTVDGVVNADLHRDGLPDTSSNRMKRLASNIRRHHEEAELYRRNLPASLFDRFGFRNVTLYRTQAGHDIFRRSIAEFFEKRVSVAASLGGTKVRIGLVDEEGNVLETTPAIDWRVAFGITGEDPAESDFLMAGIAGLMRHAEELLPPGRVSRYCIATKGPLEERGGVLLLRPDGRMPNMPFDRYPIAKKLREMTGARDVVVIHDGAAAVLGEVSRWGTLAGEANASILILGTGVGLGVMVAGRVYEGDPSDPLENKLGSVGRHLIYCPAGNGYRFEYRPIHSGASQAQKTENETYMTERFAGKHLFPRLTSEALNRRLVPHRVYMELLRDMDMEHIGEDHKKLDAAMPAGITTAALHGNDWARSQITKVGQELGAALVVLTRQFTGRPFWGDKIALVSTVAEKFGAQVRGATDDLFLETINDVLKGSDIRQRVVRSSYVDRELSAFSRWDD